MTKGSYAALVYLSFVLFFIAMVSGTPSPWLLVPAVVGGVAGLWGVTGKQ